MRTRRGMTLIEIVTVIAIIAVLAAILFPVFARSRERARCHACTSNLVNIGLALQFYAADHGGLYPPTEDDLSPLIGRYIRNAQVFLCPSQVYPGVPMGAPANRKLLEQTPPPAGPPMPPEWDEEAAPQGGPTTNYYYRAGHTRDEAPSAPIVSEHEVAHQDRANVLYSDGHVRRLREADWRALGFTPLRDLTAPPGMGMGGMPGGMPGMPPGAPGAGPSPMMPGPAPKGGKSP
jgi:prepilin-type N-terminal cleavage/methylation domain-containing protein/prepilin-type processing-associated H-X9-DG protein